MVGAAGQERGWDGVWAARAGALGNKEVEMGALGNKEAEMGHGWALGKGEAGTWVLGKKEVEKWVLGKKEVETGHGWLGLRWGGHEMTREWPARAQMRVERKAWVGREDQGRAPKSYMGQAATWPATNEWGGNKVSGAVMRREWQSTRQIT